MQAIRMKMSYTALSIPHIARYLEAIQRLGNPSHVLFKRVFGKPEDIMTVVDRESGIRCRCTVGSYHMFGATWYSHDYDVPHVPIRPGDVVLDIGANQGFFTCYAAHRGARVYAFEPNPESYDMLLSNVNTNGLMDRVIARPWAVASKEGRADLLVSRELGGGMSTINAKFARNTRLEVRNTVEVPTVTLTQVFDHFSMSKVRLCKIDAEGSEIAILQTLTPQHLTTIDSFAAEIHPEAYSTRELAETVFSWGTHQMGFNDEREFSAPIMRIISNRLLLDGISVSKNVSVDSQTSNGVGSDAGEAIFK
jgi:FkbM family methyltransferase